MATTLCHACKLTPIRDLMDATFNGIVDNTDLTESTFLSHNVIECRKIVLRGRGIIHKFSQKRT
jgi:hypothetical protein